MFTVTTIVAMITLGPDMLFVLGCGMRGGPRAGLPATAGVATSEAIHVAVAAVGLAGRIGGWLRRRAAARRRVDVATGGILIGLGVKLAVER
ncbi:hypothetical protein [Nonomuraea sp. NPDC052265]|uniref:hypothetical protein n=1 Tax=Nonomuraea sp. NPDC052265 TaxID=3364374 RepID=UPI0037C52470